MTEVYKHQTIENYIYIRVFNDVKLADCAFILETLHRIFRNRYDYVIIIHYDNAHLIDNDFMAEAARLAKTVEKYIQESYIVGLTGVQKLFYSMYIKFFPSKRIKRHAVDTLGEVNTKLQISINNDYKLFRSNEK